MSISCRAMDRRGRGSFKCRGGRGGLKGQGLEGNKVRAQQGGEKKRGGGSAGGQRRGFDLHGEAVALAGGVGKLVGNAELAEVRVGCEGADALVAGGDGLPKVPRVLVLPDGPPGGGVHTGGGSGGRKGGEKEGDAQGGDKRRLGRLQGGALGGMEGVCGPQHNSRRKRRPLQALLIPTRCI